MNGCVEWQDKLADHALGMPTEPGLERHLLSCPSCAAALASLRDGARRLDRLVTQVVSAEPPPSLASGVLQRIASDARPRQQWRAAVAVTAVFLICLAVSLWQGRSARTLPEEPPSISTWRSPTASLLRSSSQPLLQHAPRLGETYYRLPTEGDRDEK